jgi:hypothetical protein
MGNGGKTPYIHYITQVSEALSTDMIAYSFNVVNEINVFHKKFN